MRKIKTIFKIFCCASLVFVLSRCASVHPIAKELVSEDKEKSEQAVNKYEQMQDGIEKLKIKISLVSMIKNCDIKKGKRAVDAFTSIQKHEIHGVFGVLSPYAKKYLKKEEKYNLLLKTVNENEIETAKSIMNNGLKDSKKWAIKTLHKAYRSDSTAIDFIKQGLKDAEFEVVLESAVALDAIKKGKPIPSGLKLGRLKASIDVCEIVEDNYNFMQNGRVNAIAMFIESDYRVEHWIIELGKMYNSSSQEEKKEILWLLAFYNIYDRDVKRFIEKYMYTQSDGKLKMMSIEYITEYFIRNDELNKKGIRDSLIAILGREKDHSIRMYIDREMVDAKIITLRDIERIVGTMRTWDFSTKEDCINLICNIGHRAVPFLLDIYDSGDITIKSSILHMLRRIGKGSNEATVFLKKKYEVEDNGYIKQGIGETLFIITKQ
jgi:hypothetical protein